MLSVEDRLNIQETIVRSMIAADDKDVDMTVEVYTSDGEMTGAFIAEAGENFRRDAKKIYDAEGTLKRHCAINILIEGDAEEARVRYTLVVFEGETSADLLATCAVRDVLRKEDRKWLIRSHDVRIDPSMSVEVGQQRAGS